LDHWWYLAVGWGREGDVGVRAAIVDQPAVGPCVDCRGFGLTSLVADGVWFAVVGQERAWGDRVCDVLGKAM
jgi:hypothetical protein